MSIVKSISEESIDVMFDRQPDLVNGIISHSEKLHGIPLTEEWLLKFGVTIDTYFNENGFEMMAIETEVKLLAKPMASPVVSPFFLSFGYSGTTISAPAYTFG